MGKVMPELEESVSRKHFRLAAETIKALPEKDREKHAKMHADWFAKANPSFNRQKFYDAAGVPSQTANVKGFNIKRDKDGSGFSMMVHKKIKGFEEETEMEDGQYEVVYLNEAEGIATVSTKGYHGSKPMNPKYRKSTKGFINFKGGKPESENDEKVLAWHKAEAAKLGKVTQLRYRGPRDNLRGRTYSPGAYQVRGGATGAAIYYKDKSELGGRQRDAARKARAQAKLGEETMNEDEEQNEYQGPEVSDLVVSALDQKPLDFQHAFNELLQDRIADAVYDKKIEIASGYVMDANTVPIEEPDDDNDDDYGWDELTADEQGGGGEAPEQPEAE